MAKFLYRPDHPEANENGMVPAEVAWDTREIVGATHVISDTMDATKHMADGKYYTSKSEFRKATRAAGCVEVGNELSTLTKPRAPAQLDRAKRREDIKRTIYELRNGIRR